MRHRCFFFAVLAEQSSAGVVKTKNGLWNRRRGSRYTVSNAIPYNPSVVSTLELANREP